jgi:hypothetical protein
MNNSTRSRTDDTAEIPATAEIADIEEAPKDEKAEDEKKTKLELSLTQIVGGALAAMTAAALGSTLGVGGTIVGAAFASIVAGVAGALYTTSLRRTHDRVRTVFVGRGGAITPVAIEEPEPAVPVERARRTFPWKAAVVVALSVFALAALAITGLEALTGRSLSGSEGTTVQQVGGGAEVTKPKPSVQPSAANTPSAVEPSETPSASTEPSATETVSAPVTPSAPVPSTSPTVSTPPSGTPTPSASAPVPSAPAS